MEQHPDQPGDTNATDTTELADLLTRVAAKDRAAFETLYKLTVPRLFGLAMRITQQQAMAEEVISDLYFQVWKQAGNYSPTRGSVVAWLSVLCRSRALDALRRENAGVNRAAVGLDAVPEPEDRSEPPDLLQSVQLGSAIHAALSTLSDPQRQLVALAYFRGYTHNELAAITNMPIGTVKTHLHRTMIKLKEFMSEANGLNGGSDE